MSPHMGVYVQIKPSKSRLITDQSEGLVTKNLKMFFNTQESLDYKAGIVYLFVTEGPHLIVKTFQGHTRDGPPHWLFLNVFLKPTSSPWPLAPCWTLTLFDFLLLLSGCYFYSCFIYLYIDIQLVLFVFPLGLDWIWTTFLIALVPILFLHRQHMDKCWRKNVASELALNIKINWAVNMCG